MTKAAQVASHLVTLSPPLRKGTSHQVLQSCLVQKEAQSADSATWALEQQITQASAAAASVTARLTASSAATASGAAFAAAASVAEDAVGVTAVVLIESSNALSSAFKRAMVATSAVV